MMFCRFMVDVYGTRILKEGVQSAKKMGMNKFLPGLCSLKYLYQDVPADSDAVKISALVCMNRREVAKRVRAKRTNVKLHK
jgi:hypothetical protein